MKLCLSVKQKSRQRVLKRNSKYVSHGLNQTKSKSKIVCLCQKESVCKLRKKLHYFEIRQIMKCIFSSSILFYLHQCLVTWSFRSRMGMGDFRRRQTIERNWLTFLRMNSKIFSCAKIGFTLLTNCAQEGVSMWKIYKCPLF